MYGLFSTTTTSNYFYFQVVVIHNKTHTDYTYY